MRNIIKYNTNSVRNIFPAESIIGDSIANLRHALSKTQTCPEPEFKLFWVKLCSTDNHYITTISYVYR